MGFAVAQLVDRWRVSQLSLCLAGRVHLTSLTVLVLRLFSQVLTCWRETLGLKDLEMSLKDKGGYESWTRLQLREELRARKARVSGHKKELIQRCVPDVVILTVGNVHLNHINECYCFVTKAQLCGAPPTEWVSGEPHCGILGITCVWFPTFIVLPYCSFLLVYYTSGLAVWQMLLACLVNRFAVAF